MPTLQEMEEALRRRGKDPRSAFEKIWGGVKKGADTVSRYTPLGFGIDQAVKQYYKGHTKRMAQPITEAEIRGGTAERRARLYGEQAQQAPGVEEIGQEPAPRPVAAQRPGRAPFAYPPNYPSHLKRLEQNYGFRQGSLIDIQREGLFAAQSEPTWQGPQAYIRRPERGAGVSAEVYARGPELSPEQRQEGAARLYGPGRGVEERRASLIRTQAERDKQWAGQTKRRDEQIRYSLLSPVQKELVQGSKREALGRQQATLGHERALELKRRPIEEEIAIAEAGRKVEEPEPTNEGELQIFNKLIGSHPGKTDAGYRAAIAELTEARSRIVGLGYKLPLIKKWLDAYYRPTQPFAFIPTGG